VTPVDVTARQWRLVAWTTILMMGVGCLALLLSRAFLFNEGSEQFIVVLERGIWFRIDQALVGTRPSKWLLFLPMLATASVTDSLQAVALAFGAGHLMVPLVALLAVVLGLGRQRPRELVLSMVGVCLVGLPGQFYAVSGQLALTHLFWVVVVCIVRSPDSGWAPWLGGLTVTFLFLLNPVSAVYFGVAGVTLLAASLWSASTPGLWRKWSYFLLGTALLRLVLLSVTSDSVRLTDSSHPSLYRLEESFLQPRMWLVATYYALTIGAALLVAWKGRVAWRWFVPMTAAGALSLLAFFVGNPLALQHGMNYIGWMAAASVPLIVVCLLVATDTLALPSVLPGVLPRVLPGAVREIGPSAAWMLAAPAAVFMSVTVVQSYQFSSQLAFARGVVASQEGPCVAREALQGAVRNSFDDTYDTFQYEYLATSPSRLVTRVVLDTGRCAHVCRLQAPPVRGFFQLRMPEGSSARAWCPLGGLLN
jgi:hypothetical protein